MQGSCAPLAADVVVVGASFAGTACALAAARRGLRVCVLKRRHDPGGKLRTTGILVKEAAESTLLKHLPATMTRRIEQVRLYSPSLKQLALTAPGYYFLTTDTAEVMRWLCGQLRAHGVDLRLGSAFTDCERRAIGWLAQNPGGVQAGLAMRHDASKTRVPDIDGFLLHAGRAGGLPRMLKPGHTRAGLIPCGGPVANLARNRAILTGDAAGIVSPVTGGGIHDSPPLRLAAVQVYFRTRKC